jgi:hypothetical protein
MRTVTIVDFRLVKFDSSQEYIDSSFDDSSTGWTMPFSQVLGGVRSVYTFDLLAETKKPGVEFEKYISGGSHPEVESITRLWLVLLYVLFYL